VRGSTCQGGQGSLLFPDLEETRHRARAEAWGLKIRAVSAGSWNSDGSWSPYPPGQARCGQDAAREALTIPPALTDESPMSMPRSPVWMCLALASCLASAACRSTANIERLPGEVEYVGSSTVAVFVRQAEPVYGAVRFNIDTEAESLGGERLVREGRAQLAGIAKEPEAETLEAGVNAAPIGRDAIAVIVNAKNPVDDLPLAALDDLFAGRVKNWREVGGPDLEVRPFIVSEDSATREVFRNAVLGPEDYAGCESVSPDAEIITAVSDSPGGVGHISMSLLGATPGVRAISIDGERPEVANFDYPISRPLYLLWRDAPVVDAFARWAQGEEGQQVVMASFVGNRVIGSVEPLVPKDLGILVVRTETFEYQENWDDFTYFPHRPYDLLDRNGRLLRRVRNHVGEMDETPARLSLPPGTYLIRTRTSDGETVELFATVETGRVTEVDVEDFLAKHLTKGG